uniref:Uncharacterized protein n=1 Tax=Oryza sativa subsp. japonica TaxID=39947 RepID=Q6AUY5_ORYSJ|nr:hypothetical protein [Oryza sativa Japonica Group]
MDPAVEARQANVTASAHTPLHRRHRNRRWAQPLSPRQRGHAGPHLTLGSSLSSQAADLAKGRQNRPSITGPRATVATAFPAGSRRLGRIHGRPRRGAPLLPSPSQHAAPCLLRSPSPQAPLPSGRPDRPPEGADPTPPCPEPPSRPPSCRR